MRTRAHRFVEYGLLLPLVSVVILAAITLLGTTLSSLFTSPASSIYAVLGRSHEGFLKGADRSIDSRAAIEDPSPRAFRPLSAFTVTGMSTRRLM